MNAKEQYSKVVWLRLNGCGETDDRRADVVSFLSAHNRTTLSSYIFATKARIDNRNKLLSSDISPTCPHNMVNFGPLAAEIVLLVWDTPANFNEFRVLAALLHGTLLVGVSQTAALNRGRHLYLAGRPSRWALAHISSLQKFRSSLTKD